MSYIKYNYMINMVQNKKEIKSTYGQGKNEVW